MNLQPPQPSRSHRTPFLRLALLAGIATAAAVLLREPLTDLWHRPAVSPPVQLQLPPTPVAPQPPARLSLDDVRQQARDRARPHLDRADRACERPIAEHLQVLDRFFRDTKQGTRGFAADALGWNSKWKLVSGYLPWTDGAQHERFLREKFAEHVLKPEQLEAVLRQVVQSYVDHVHSIENRTLVDIRADLSDLPPLLLVNTWKVAELQPYFQEALRRAQAQVSADLRADVSRELLSLIVAEVLTQAAVRLGVSAGILGAGAGSSWGTLGI